MSDVFYPSLTIFFVLLCLLILLVDRLSDRVMKVLFWVVLLGFSIFLGLRPEKVPDFLSYEVIFDKIGYWKDYHINLFERELETSCEYGFIYLVILFKAVFGENFRLLIFLIAVITLFMTSFFMGKIVDYLSGTEENHAKNQLMVLLLYAPYYGMYYQGITIRAAISMSFITAAFYFALKNKWLRTLLLLFLGFTFHRMTVIGLMIIVLYKLFFPLSRRFYQAAGIIMLGWAVFYDAFGNRFASIIYGMMNALFNKVFTLLNYTSYLDKADATRIFDKKRLFLLAVFCLLAIICENTERIAKLMNLMFIGCVAIVVTLNIVGSERIFDYFMIYSVPAIATAKKDDKNPAIYNIFMAGFMILSYIIAVRVWLYPAN